MCIAPQANPSFRTARLLVRPLRRDDLDAMAAWPPFADPLDREWNWPQRLERLCMLDLFWTSHQADRSKRAWAILQGDAVVGLLQLKDIRPDAGDAFLGIAFGAPWVGKGFGRETLMAFMPVYREQLKLHTLRLEVALANTRAHRLYERLGFEERARFWRYAGATGDYHFLQAPAYAELRPYFRSANTGVYQLCVEMARLFTSEIALKAL